MIETYAPGVRAPEAGAAYWLVGHKYVLKVRGTDTGGGMAMVHATLPHAPGPPPHVHTREDEVFYVLDGEITVMLDGQVSKAGPGSTVMLPRNVKHTFWNESGETAHMLIHSTPSGLEEFFAEAGAPVADDDTGPPEMTAEMIERLYATAEKYGIIIDRPEGLVE